MTASSDGTSPHVLTVRHRLQMRRVDASRDASVTTVWDGSGTPTLHLYEQGATDYTSSLPTTAVDLTSADTDQTGDNTGAVTKPVTLETAGREFLMVDATPLRAVVDDGNGGAPESSQGEGELVLFIVAAP